MSVLTVKWGYSLEGSSDLHDKETLVFKSLIITCGLLHKGNVCDLLYNVRSCTYGVDLVPCAQSVRMRTLQGVCTFVCIGSHVIVRPLCWYY
jgi:hypothetical protein